MSQSLHMSLTMHYTYSHYTHKLSQSLHTHNVSHYTQNMSQSKSLALHTMYITVLNTAHTLSLYTLSSLPHSTCTLEEKNEENPNYYKLKCYKNSGTLTLRHTLLNTTSKKHILLFYFLKNTFITNGQTYP